MSEDIPDGWTDQQIWDNVNEPWLSDAANRGDVIRVVSDPTKVENIWINGIEGGQRSFFGREVEFLENSGYSFDSSTFEFIK